MYNQMGCLFELYVLEMSFLLGNISKEFSPLTDGKRLDALSFSKFASVKHSIVIKYFIVLISVFNCFCFVVLKHDLKSLASKASLIKYFKTQA